MPYSSVHLAILMCRVLLVPFLQLICSCTYIKGNYCNTASRNPQCRISRLTLSGFGKYWKLTQVFPFPVAEGQIPEGGVLKLPDGGGQCSLCGRSFSGLRNAKRHFSTVHLQENSPCLCPVCKKTFIRKELMKDHLRRKHKMYKAMYKTIL